MSEPSDRDMEWKSLRDRIIGLGEASTRKSYYPELQRRLADLKESEARFRAIYDSVNDAISVHDAVTGKIVDVNQRMRALFGYTQDEALGLTLGDLSSGEHPYDEQSALDLIRGIAEAESRIVEWHSRHRSGRVFWSELSLRLAKLGGVERVLVMTRDITERKEAEEAIRNSERRLADLIDFLPDATFAIDTEGRVTVWNRAVETLTGVKASEVVGKNSFEHGLAFYGKRRPMLVDMVSEIDPEYVPQYSRLERQGEMLLGEWFTLHIGENGAYLWGKAGPLFGSEGNVIGYIETVRDVTERKRVENALNDSERRLVDLIEFLPDATFAIDTRGRVTLWNHAVETLTGVKAADIVGKDDHAHGLAFYGERRPMLIDLIAGSMDGHDGDYTRLNREDDTVLGEAFTPMIREGGAYLWGKARPLHDREGNVIGYIETVRDITDRKRTEDELRESQRTLSTLMSNIPGMAYRSLNDYSWTMVFVSEGVTDLTGYPPDALIGNAKVAYGSLIHPDDREMVWQETQKALTGHYAFRITYRIRTASGDEKWVWEQGCGIYSEDGKLQTLEGLVTDITERKRSEEEKRAFYRDTIFNATDGKLSISDDKDLSPYITGSKVYVDLRTPADAEMARSEAQDFCRENGLEGVRLNDFMIGLGEAIANALKHSGSGCVYAGAADGSVWVGVSDRGTGIESLILPRAVLRRGFSTKPSLGLGYSIMLQVADQILLSTGKSGTNVLLIENLVHEPVITLDSIPDTWQGIADIG